MMIWGPALEKKINSIDRFHLPAITFSNEKQRRHDTIAIALHHSTIHSTRCVVYCKLYELINTISADEIIDHVFARTDGKMKANYQCFFVIILSASKNQNVVALFFCTPSEYLKKHGTSNRGNEETQILTQFL